MKRTIWNKKPLDSRQVSSLHDTYGIDHITASVLMRRSAGSGRKIKFFLERDLAFLHNPFLFEDMETAVQRVREAVDGQEQVCIFGDRDVDGMTSTVLLKEALEEAGAHVSWKLPQGDDPYGITRECIDWFAEQGGTLIITVDCGISSVDEVAYANNLGIDTIILDHHIPAEVLPSAAAVINPKIPGCGYPFADLAGCGVVAKFIWALRFSYTQYFQQEMVFLHARPGNQTVIIEAALIENLVELDRIIEEVNPGVLPPEQSRLMHMLTGKEILVYDAPHEYKLLREAFGTGAEIALTDIAPLIREIFPSLENKSLVKLMDVSRSVRYSSGNPSELDVLINLFTAYVYRKEPRLSSGYGDILDLVAIGTVADLMPMTDENRILVHHGLEVLQAQKRSALRTFMAKRNLLGRQLTTTDIGWQISPLLNASGRLGVPEIAVQLLSSTDLVEQERLIDELISLNRERKRLGEEAWGRLFPKAGKSFAVSGERMILVQDKHLNRGISGIIASRLVGSFNVPSIVIAHLEDKLIGSMRSGKQVHVREFLSQFADVLTDYGGHECAGGFSLHPDQLEVFIDRVKEEIKHVDPLKDIQRFQIDAEIPHAFMTPSLIDLVERLAPYGEDHPPLIFLVRNVIIDEMTPVGNSDPMHLRMLIRAGEYRWPSVFWRSADRINGDFALGERVDILFRLGRNYYRSSETLQLTILDISRNAEGLLTNLEE